MLANGRFVLPLALVLVFSAAIARQYDHVYLLKNPGFLVRPLVASFLLASFLYSILLVAFWRNLEPPRPGFRAYVTFLKLYWMTAPMAWLYAIPFERWMGVMDAAVANLWLLGVVSVWRVTLISRVVSVLFNVRWIAACPLVLLFATFPVLVVGALSVGPTITASMGGVQLPPDERLIDSVFGSLALVALWGFIPVAIGCSLASYHSRPRWEPRASWLHRSSAGVRVFAILSILGWTPILWETQHEQSMRWKVERGLPPREAVRLMSESTRDDFPQNWRLFKDLYSQHSMPAVKVDFIETALKADPAEWVNDLMYDELVYHIEGNFPITDQSVIDYARVLPLATNREALARRVLQRHEEAPWWNRGARLSGYDEALRSLRELAGISPPAPAAEEGS